MEDLMQIFTTLDMALLGAVLVLFIYQIYFYVRYLAAVLRQRKRLRKKPLAEPDEWPGVSVIVSARNEESNLKNYLQALLEQDYPKFEVIVVNDGSEDNTQIVLEEYRQKYSNLHVTFVPIEARVRSSKKLALTLAVKAAMYENLLLTDADCVPESNQWIRYMVLGLSQSSTTQMVLGYSPYFSGKGAVNSIIRYETLFNGLCYMGHALAGRPYMGVGRNMLYTKSLFVTQKGFAGQLSLRSGDDDLFVNKVTSRANTTVMCTQEALVWSLAKTTFKEWIHQKRRHLIASSYYKQSTRFMLGFENMMRGLWYVAVIVACVFGTLWVQVLTAALFLIRWLVLIGTINASASKMGEKRFGWIVVLWYDICLPVLTAFLLSTQPKNQNNRW